MIIKTHWYKNNLFYLLWSIGLLAYIFFIANEYCRMYYGGGFLYVLTGQGQITEEERAYLRRRGNLVYADTLDSFPAQLYDESLQEEEGFNMDLMNQLSLEMGAAIRFLPVEWPEVFDTLESGQADFIQISYSEERDETYFLTEPLYRNRGIVLLRKEGERIRTLEELTGMKIAGIRKDYAMEVLREKVPTLDIQEYGSIAECADVLTSGLADGIVSDEQNMMYYVQQENLLQDYYILEKEVYSAGVVFAVPRSEEELGRILNKVVYKLRNSGILDGLQQKWFLQSVLEPVVTEREQIIWLLECFFGVALFFILLFWYIQFKTNALVEERTAELDQERKKLEVILQSVPHHLFEIDSYGELMPVNQKRTARASEKEKQQTEDAEICFLKELDWKKMLRESEGQGYAQKDFRIGSRRYRITIGAVGTASAPEHALLLMEDITLQHIQLQQNIQNSKMAAIGQLASGVSHELKNPLEIICNYCYAIKKGILHTEEQIQDTIKVIEEEAKNANQIVDNLLSFARIAPDQTELTEIGSLIRMILKLQANLLKKRNIRAELDCEEGICVRCNPEGLKRIFVNLIRNAQEAMPDGGTIRIRVQRLCDTVSIEISDTGTGMSEQTQEQIFHPFFTTKDTGTGLGLYLVYHQVKESSGAIEVSSREGEGTVFRLTFPGVTEEADTIGPAGD